MSACPIPALSAVTTPTDIPARPVTDSEQAGLLHALAKVPDPRSPRGLRYPLAALLTVAVCAVTAGASSVAAIADWLRHNRSTSSHGPAQPAADTPSSATVRSPTIDIRTV